MPAARPDQPRRSHRPRRAATLGAALAACAVLAASAGAAPMAGGSGAQAPAPAVPGPTTFDFTGKPVQWTVPAGITTVRAHVCGGTGSMPALGSTGPSLIEFANGGLGGCVDADLAVTPGDVLIVNVGARGAPDGGQQSAYGGGGVAAQECIGGNGGGASDIRIGGAAPNRVLVGGGGGGGGEDQLNGGPGGTGGGTGGTPDGAPGQDGVSPGPDGAPTGGGGAVGNLPGAGGKGNRGFSVWGNPGTADGSGGSSKPAIWCGGGGGGGYAGGGSGSGDNQSTTGAAGGGGGSSYADSTRSTNVTYSPGPRPGGLGGSVTGDGVVTLTPIAPTTTPTITAAPSTVTPTTIAPATMPTSTAAPTTTATPPNPPTITSAVPTTGGTPQVNVTFTLTSAPQATGVVFSTNGGTTWTAPTQPVSGSSGTFTFTTGSNGKPLPPGGTVSIVMAATGPGGQSQPTPATNVSIPAAAVVPSSTAASSTTATAQGPTGGGGGTGKPAASLCPATPVVIFATVGSAVNADPYAGSPPSGATFATGSAPAGLTVDPNDGTITGTPTAVTAGPQQVTATVTSGATTQTCPLADITVTAQAPAKLTVTPGVPAVLTPPTAPPPGAAYSLAKGAPASMTIDPGTGTVAWTPTAGDKGTVTVTVNQSGTGTTASTSTSSKVVFRVAAPNSAATTVNAPASTTTTIPASVATEAPGAGAYEARDGGACLAPVADIYPDVSWTAGSTLTVAPDTIGLAAPTSFTITGGSLPEGITLDNQVGVISGTPLSTNGGDGPAAITVTFADGTQRRTVFNVGVTGTGTHVLDYPNRIIGSVGEDVTITPAEHGGDGPARHTIVCGDLPAGMELDEATGQITGTPVAPDEFPEPIRIRSTRARTSTSGIAAPAGDTSGGYTESSFILVVAPEPVEWLRYPSTAVLGTGEAADITPTVSGIAKGERFKIVSGTLPKGPSFDTATGRITGTLEQAITRPLGLTIALDHANGTTAASADLILAGAPVAGSTGSRNWLWVALIALLVVAVGVIAFVVLRRRHDGPGSPHDRGLTIHTGPAGTPDLPYHAPPETQAPTAT